MLQRVLSFAIHLFLGVALFCLFDLRFVAVLFGEDAAAVFLHIKPHLTRFALPLAEAGAKVAVIEGNAVFLAHRLAHGL